MSTYDFEDGNGPVPAHKHPNGGGWVADTAKVAESAYVSDDARVYGNAKVYGNAWVYDNAEVSGYAWVYGNAEVYGNAWVYDNADVSGNTRVSGNAKVYGVAEVSGYAWISDGAKVSGYAMVSGDAMVCGDAVCTREPKVLAGFPHTVTITDHHIRAGCQQHPPSVWLERGAAIIKTNGHSTEQAKEWSQIINLIAKAHGCVDKDQLS